MIRYNLTVNITVIILNKITCSINVREECSLCIFPSCNEFESRMNHYLEKITQLSENNILSRVRILKIKKKIEKIPPEKKNHASSEEY